VKRTRDGDACALDRDGAFPLSVRFWWAEIDLPRGRQIRETIRGDSLGQVLEKVILPRLAKDHSIYRQ